MNPRIFVGALVAAFAVTVGIVAFAGQTLINDVSEEGIFSAPSDSPKGVLPITVELEDLSIVEVTDKFAVLEIEFLVSNPNYKSVILQYITYQLFENSEVDSVYTGTIGERPGGFVVGSNYFTILSDTPTIFSDKITIKNTGNTPEFWSALANNTPKWKITGEAFFNLSSITSGAENEITFEFVK